jgi:molecular chaperone DnaK
MVNEAESFATDDKAKKERAELYNQAETMVYSTERTLQEVKDKVSDADKQSVNAGITKLKEALEAKDEGRIKTAMEELTHASHALAQALYAKAGATGPGPESQAGGGAGPADGGHAGGGAGKAKDDNVVDAEFEEVRDNK